MNNTLGLLASAFAGVPKNSDKQRQAAIIDERLEKFKYEVKANFSAHFKIYR